MVMAGTLAPLANGQPTNGPQYAVHRVACHSSDVFYVRFFADELTRVVVRGDGDTDLDLYVYDEFGRLIASDTDLTDRCAAVWYPSCTGTYRIVVVNRGSVYNQYEIAAW
jgi:hypothetical protein